MRARSRRHQNIHCMRPELCPACGLSQGGLGHIAPVLSDRPDRSAEPLRAWWARPRSGHPRAAASDHPVPPNPPETAPCCSLNPKT
eukprot:3102506-Pyramimonas_sp.AAC.1